MLLCIEGFEGVTNIGQSVPLAEMLLSKGHYCFHPGGVWTDAGRLAGISFMDHANRGFALRYYTTNDTLIIGFGYKATAWPGIGVATDILSVMDHEGNVHALIQMYDIDEWRVVVPEGTYTTVNSSGGGAGWYYVEFKIVISEVGSFDLKINEVSQLDDDTIDTQANSDGYSCYALFKGTTAWRWMDDIYVCDGTGDNNNDFLGACQVIAKFPDGDGSSSGFTPSAGDNHQNVDDNPVDSDTTYNDGSNSDIDYYTYDALTESYLVRGLQVNTTVRTTDAGSMSVQNKVQSGGFVTTGAERFLNITYSTEHDIVENDPNTDDIWTIDGINSAEFGLEVI